MSPFREAPEPFHHLVTVRKILCGQITAGSGVEEGHGLPGSSKFGLHFRTFLAGMETVQDPGSVQFLQRVQD